MRYLSLGRELFAKNRRRFIEKMEGNQIALFFSANPKVRSGDTYYPYRQDASFFYFTGLEEPGGILLLKKGETLEDSEEILFVRSSDPRLKAWEGARYSKEEASAISGLSRVHTLKEFKRVLHPLVIKSKGIYFDYPDSKPGLVSFSLRQKMDKMRLDYPTHDFHPARPIVRELRMVKSTKEVQQIQKANTITEKAFREVLEKTQAGMWEFDLEAIITSCFIRNRSGGHAFAPIIASGENSTILHYDKNNCLLKTGDLLLLDFGAEYANYASDISRTIPISGRFSPRQRQVYEGVLKVLKKAQELLAPGLDLRTYDKQVGQFMEEELCLLGLISPKEIRDSQKGIPAYKRYFIHRASHHLGLDVHDESLYSAPLEEGMVLTCEPGIYIPEEGFGIRLENNILIEKEGSSNLSESIPIEVDELESLMAKK